ncbi:helix-turn-helix domain-containing protein [Amycolatopsis methanolica]|uniref:Transcriptional regulator, CdaR n=1 Tax=Amycolatopsis methanolica 239 TaxID=1068978 RepID=A0A076MZD2_AMYME|nr:helix-turn-helix domain-containing protein [Amycolatopsis methanolica]AIJ26594.1 transcriptional regulator, CdaR [Amycolatopsis methanolica 239]
MQELLGRISALDPRASLSLRVIACFDELIVGNVNTRALLSAAASLAGCNAGFSQQLPPRAMRVTTKGAIVPGPFSPAAGSSVCEGGVTAWLERDGAQHVNDAIILERLLLALRLRHGHGRRDSDHRRELGLLLDTEAPIADRHTVASRLNLSLTGRYRVLAAPLFAVWHSHPTCVEDVVATPYGSIHALVVPESHDPVDASPCGIGLPTGVDKLDRSFRTAIVALRLCLPPHTPVVTADTYGALIGLLADLPDRAAVPDLDALDSVMAHPWGPATVDVLIQAGSVRQAARLAGVHHSTLQTRVDTITEIIGFDPLDGLGRSRLGTAYLCWRLRNSRVLDLPPPTGGRSGGD